MYRCTALYSCTAVLVRDAISGIQLYSRCITADSGPGAAQRYRALALVPSGAVERVGFSGIAEDRALVLARTRAGRTHGLKLRLVGAEVPRASSRTFGNC